MNATTVRSFLTRISSRKFLTTLAVEVAALIVLFAPDQADTVTAAVEHVAAIVSMTLAALGYVSAEARLDGQALDDDAPAY